MKVLITYFSQTGNTEKIAKSIHEEAALHSEAHLVPLVELSPDMLEGYDAMIIGSPLHSATLAEPVKACLESMTPSSIKCMAGFITHFAPAYPDQDMKGFAEPLQAACAKNNMEYMGTFDCQGYLTDNLHGMVQEKLGLTDEKWEEMVTQMTGRPNDEDVKSAKAFVRALLT